MPMLPHPGPIAQAVPGNACPYRRLGQEIGTRASSLWAARSELVKPAESATERDEAVTATVPNLHRSRIVTPHFRAVDGGLGRHPVTWLHSYATRNPREDECATGPRGPLFFWIVGRGGAAASREPHEISSEIGLLRGPVRASGGTRELVLIVRP